MRDGRIAVPSNGEGGLDGLRAGHFGHCDVFTCIDVENGQIKSVTTLQNEAHVQGGCMVPVNLLASHNVNALVVGGIGMRPLMGFKQVGIDVYHNADRAEIRSVVEDLIADKLPEMRHDQVCGGAAGNGKH
ncbi:dinitrogenase iron-molybdenum cofactor protein [Olavius algarvensis Delta 1 endosymbiont]|nr:dinitrogenase iron-molybdenum cofactor protein [Olavius algarvensis Delta 1 endosymbiont]